MAQRKYTGGDVWSAVRSALSDHRERLVQAFDAGSFERESAILDDVARRIAEKVDVMIDTYADKTH